MNTLEVVHLRLAGDDIDQLAEVVRQAVGDISRSNSVRIYRHARVENDLLIHIHRGETSGDEKASELGLQLASLLRIYGLVEHSVWVQVPD